jgi:hypothetical protein
MRDFKVATVWRMNFAARLHLKLFLEIVRLVADELQDMVHASGNLLVEGQFFQSICWVAGTLPQQMPGSSPQASASPFKVTFAARHSFFKSGTSRSQAPCSNNVFRRGNHGNRI